jgi:hypothetical protein
VPAAAAETLSRQPERDVSHDREWTPAAGMMEVAMLPAQNREFTRFTLDRASGARRLNGRTGMIMNHASVPSPLRPWPHLVSRKRLRPC